MAMMKKNTSIIRVLIISLLIIFCIWLYKPAYTVPILTYHSIGYQDDLITVTPENFDRQLTYLKRHHYKVISLDRLVDDIKRHKRFNRKSVVITFDDGREDNYTYAYPILKKYHFSVTIFLATNLISNKPGFLTWDEVRTMSENGISFGAHTRNHVFLASIASGDKLWDEIAGAKKAVEQNIKKPVDYFSYPFGAFNEKVKLVVEKAGFKGACTTNVGPKRLNEDVYTLKRIRVKNTDTDKFLSFWAKLSGYYNLFRRPRLEVEP